MSKPPAKNLGAGDAWGRWVETAISKLSGTTSQVSQQAVNASLSAQATTAAVGRTATDLTSLATSVGNIQENVGATLDVALTAQEAADLVNSELILLSGKTGRVIYSEVEPTGDDANVNNLWIETTTGKLYSYVDGTWTLVTDERLIAAANTADAATNLANAAQAQADLAKGLADAAQSTANTANTAAGAANTAALNAASGAANAQSTADTANTNALAAQTTANAAESNLLVLAGKTGRTIRQEDAPTGADANANNLWIKTSTGQTYSYVGSTWTLITDTRITAAADAATAAQTTATNAATAAATAQTTANNAAAAALAAQNTADTANNKATTADGRYTVAASNPTVSDGSGKPTDAVWEVRSGATMLRRFVWTGTAWTQVKAGQDFIGDKAIGQAQIGDLAVGTAQLADASITNAKIGELTVGSANITDTLTGKTIRGGLLSSGRKDWPGEGYAIIGPRSDDVDNNPTYENGVFLSQWSSSSNSFYDVNLVTNGNYPYLSMRVKGDMDFPDRESGVLDSETTLDPSGLSLASVTGVVSLQNTFASSSEWGVRHWREILSKRPLAIRKTSEAQSIPNASWTLRNFNSSTEEYVGGTAASSNAVSVPRGGWYSITARTVFSGTSSGIRRGIRLRFSGTGDDQTSQFVGVSGVSTSQSVQTTVLRHLTSSDIVAIEVYQDTGSAINSTQAQLYIALQEYDS